jgi:hypothetical protein
MGIERLAISTKRGRGRGHLRVDQLQDLARDALGVVADALELQVELDGRVGEAQVAGHRLLAYEELEAQPVGLLLELVDALVAQDHRVGQLAVALLEGLDAVQEGLLGERGHRRQPVADPVDLALQGLLQVRRHRESGWEEGRGTRDVPVTLYPARSGPGKRRTAVVGHRTRWAPRSRALYWPRPMNEWRIHRREARCGRCERTFTEGEAIFSLLFFDAQGLRREDRCQPCFEGASPGSETETTQLVFWRTRHDPDRRTRFAVDFEAIEELFLALDGRAEGRLPELRYLLTLLLLRKKRLKLVGVRRHGADETLCVRRPRRAESSRCACSSSMRRARRR